MKPFREQFDIDVEANSLSADIVMDRLWPYDPKNPAEDLAVQSAKDDADINVIIKRFGLASVAKPQPIEYYDLTELTDFQSSLAAIERARTKFLEIPSHIRAKFDNDPGQFLPWLRDEKNHEEARSLGLLTPKPAPPTPMKVEVVNPAPGPSA